LKYERAPFQIEDIAKLQEFGRATANFSEMGCYKTTTAEFLLEDLDPARTLIVTSKTGKVTYLQTLPSVLPGVPLMNIESAHVPNLKYNGIYLAHYNLFTKKSKICKAIRAAKWDAIILDESHRIKNPKAQCTMQLRYVKAGWRHIMTGSPFINDPSDMWAQIKFLTQYTGGSIPGYWAFRDYYCELSDESGYTRVVGIKPERKAEFKEMVYSFSVRRTKAEVFKDLPEKLQYSIPVDLNPTQRRMYNEIKNELMAMDEDGTPFHSPNVLSALQRLRQITSATPYVTGRHWIEKEERWAYNIELREPSSKLDAVMDLLAEATNQVVIFYLHRDIGKLLNARLQRAGISHTNMVERDNAATRLAKVNAFQDGSYKVFHCTLQLGGESITLTSADTVVFIDESWSPKDNNQGEDRVHRPGQTRPTNVVHIYGRNTTDGYVRSKLNMKNGWFKEIFEVTPTHHLFERREIVSGGIR
jgi:SNF2 family DNA or RNA helicase